MRFAHVDNIVLIWPAQLRLIVRKCKSPFNANRTLGLAGNTFQREYLLTKSILGKWQRGLNSLNNASYTEILFFREVLADRRFDKLNV